MRTMYDSVNPDAIPAGAEMIAVYATGPYRADLAAVRARFPRPAVIIRIDVQGFSWSLASVLDVERGDATPAMARQWIISRQAYAKRIGKHLQCTVYANRSTMPAVQHA